MLKRFSENKKYLLLGITFILVMVSYNFAIKKTVDAWYIHQHMTTQLAYVSDLEDQPAYLNRKSINLDRALNQYTVDTISYRSNSINTISLLAEQQNIKLSSVPLQDISYQMGNMIIQRLEFNGGYFSLLKFSRILQGTKGIGVIRSEEWRVLKVRLNNNVTNRLVMDIYLEILKK